MEQDRQVNKPIKLNLDKDPKYLGADEAMYMLNTERYISGGGKSNLGKTSPMPANELLCEVETAGNPLRIGSFQSELTNEVYSFYYNEEGVNYILRINEDKTCEIVYQGECLQFSAAPEHAIENWRVYLKYDKFCAHMGGKQLIWTDGLNPIGQIDVEASIDTNGFDTPFFSRCAAPCATLQMCVPEICGAIDGEFIPLEPGDVDLNNKLIDNAFQVRIRHVYYDQRASEWSDISPLYFQDAKGCFDTEEGFPRCMKFRIPIGNPLVEKIEFAYRNNNEVQWYRSDTIDKYLPYTSQSQKWYERDLAELLNYSDDDCSFDYIFCNDKDCEPIDTNQTSRISNPIPREAQGLFPIKDSIGFYNYKKGNCPLIESETKKFTVSIDCPETNYVTKYSSVKFRLITHQFYQNINQPVYRLGGDTLTDEDDTSDTAYFGGAMVLNPLGGILTAEPELKYNQYFRGKTRNFIAYIEGTGYFVEMEQYKASAGFNDREKTGILSGMSKDPNYLAFDVQRRNGTFYYEQGEFMVPRGSKGYIRIVSHEKTNGEEDAQNTSTFVIGTLNNLNSYSGDANIGSSLNYYKYELYFDTCDGDVDIEETFVVTDSDIKNSGSHHSASSYGGYITDKNNAPVEGAEIWGSSIEIWGSSILRTITDHNGFYNFYDYGGQKTPITVSVRVEQSSSGGFIEAESVTLANEYNYTEKDIKIDAPGYIVNYYEDVSVLVQDCDAQPVGGIHVALSGSKYKVTDAITGIAHFKVRNYSTRNRVIKAVVMDYNGCFSLDCDNNYNPCLPVSNNISLSSSFEGVPYINFGMTSFLNRESALINKKGLKSGGRYPIGIVVQGVCGKVSSVYPVTVMDGSVPLADSFLDIPKTQDKGELSFCSLSYDATGIVLPEWATCLKVVRGYNLNGYVLQWVVDKIERVSNGKIKLTIQSLNDYNASYDFKSNTVYQYKSGDRVEFISNGGGGEIFDTATYGLLNYLILSPFHDKVVSGEQDAPAEYFNQILIQDDGSLDGLKEGAKIEIQRPIECTIDNAAYFEIGISLRVIEISGVKTLEVPTGTFMTFDTYIVNRQIGGTGIKQFEHMNPSDFWGDKIFGISDIGKPHFKNKFENEQRFGRNITLNTKGQFNRFGDFEKKLDAPEQGDIISIGIYDGKIGIAISEFDNATFQVSDEFLRVASDGTVRAAPIDSIISDTQPKVAGQYGCQYQHIGSVYYGDGFVIWADVNKSALVKSDFNVAKDIAEAQANSYFNKKWNMMEAFNATSQYDVDRYRFMVGFNFHTKALILTMKQLSGANINNEKAELLAGNETILIEPRTEEILTFASFTQDGYSNITVKDGSGCAFLSFVGSSVYIHPVITNVFNRFNGVAVDRVVSIAININPDIIKRAIGIEIQDELMWFVSKVLVDRTSFESEIPPIRMTKEEDKWVSSFLSDKNSHGGIYATGDVATKPRGYFILVTLVRDNTIDNKYNTINDAKRLLYSTLDMVLFSYFYSAKSGFK